MHSFHHSRGRVLFESACALTISASCVGAWMDLGVPALLAAAAVSALYGLVHLFDMRGPPKDVAIDALAGPEGDVAADVDTHLAEPAEAFAGFVEERQPMVEVLPAIEPAQALQPRPKKRKSSKKAAPIVEIQAVELPEPTVEFEPIAEAEAVADAEPARSEPDQQPEGHAPVTPLFEPEPFVRQQRAVFGRKAG